MSDPSIIPPLNGDDTLPQVGVFLSEPRGGHWKYTTNLLNHIETPCILVTSNPIPQEKHWCLPILKWSPGPHRTIAAKGRLLLIHFQNLVSLLRTARKYKIKTIHFQSFEPISMGILLPFLMLRSRLLFSVHNVLPHSYYTRFTKPLEIGFRRWIYRQADHLFVFSRYGAGKLSREFGIPSQKITYLPMGCHEPLPKPTPQRQSRPDQPTFLMFGGYRPNKGFEVLRDAFLRAKQAGLPGRLQIAGSYPPEIELHTLDLFRQRELENQISFINKFIPEDQIDGIMKSADLIVMPYTGFESQSGVVFLAYAYNLPLIVSRVGGLTEVIESDGTGILVTPGSVEELSEALIFGFNNYQALVAHQPALLLSTKYSWENIGRGTDQIYAHIAAKAT